MRNKGQKFRQMVYSYKQYFHFETGEYLKYYRKKKDKKEKEKCNSKSVDSRDTDFDPYEYYQDFDVIVNYEMF